MAEINDWNVAAGSNTSAVPDGWPEGMTSSQINNTAREGMAVVKRAWSDSVEGNKDSTGSSNGYLVAANRVLSAYYDGMRIGFHASFANTGPATLDVDSVDPKPIVKYHDVALASGDIEANQYVDVVFSATDDAWQLQTPLSTGADLVNDTSPQLGGDLDLNGNNIDFPTTADISDCLDDDSMATASATTLATSESIKAYADAAAALVEGAKGWVVFDAAGTIPAGGSFNVATVDDDGTGDFGVNWDTDFSSANYTVVATSQDAGNDSGINVDTKLAGSTEFLVYKSSSGALQDPDLVHVASFGAQ